MNRNKTRRLIEAALMVALATVLSVFKLVEMPYGGSVTFASMLPVLILSYRHGVAIGLGGGFVSAVIQQLLGLKYLSYFTTWQSVVALILLDYIVAFTVVGLGGIFRKIIKSQSAALAVGAISVGVLRYICHVIAGCTVWVGLSIPDSEALIYSLGYNATYMLPETIVLTVVALNLSRQIDFTRETPERVRRESKENSGDNLIALAWLTGAAGIVADVVTIAPSLQDAESGMFIVSGLKDAPWVTVAIISAVCLITSLLFVILAKKQKKTEG